LENVLGKFPKSAARTVFLSKHTVAVVKLNYYDVVGPLLYITYRGFIYDIML